MFVRLQIVQEDLEFDLGEHDEIRMLLKQDYTAEVLSADGSSTGEKADWNMIYDQAMYVNLPDRGL